MFIAVISIMFLWLVAGMFVLFMAGDGVGLIEETWNQALNWFCGLLVILAVLTVWPIVLGFIWWDGREVDE
jgi:hypothetical protein